jgi:3',5'-cyclic AMP phosphodiesterase CpdA
VTSFLLAHLSDAHIGPLPKPLRRELMNKRFTGYMNWIRRAQIHDMKVLRAIVDDARAQNPDHIAMTGDVMNIGLPAEFPIARAWLQTLGDPQNVSFTPGNHDAYVRGSLPFITETFAPWCSNDAENHTVFPYLRVRGDVALIGVSSGVPTLPLLASGRLGLEQREALAKLLDDTGQRGLMRVVMIHHPPTQGGAKFARGLTDARELEKLIVRHGAELIIHGHNHRLQVRHIEGGGRRVPCVGVASASAVPGTPLHRAAYHLYRFEKSGNAWKIDARIRGTAPGGEHVTDIGPIEL